VRTLRKFEDVFLPVDDLQAAALEPSADITCRYIHVSKYLGSCLTSKQLRA
jgi:hypothetical protein